MPWALGKEHVKLTRHAVPHMLSKQASVDANKKMEHSQRIQAQREEKVDNGAAASSSASGAKKFKHLRL